MAREGITDEMRKAGANVLYCAEDEVYGGLPLSIVGDLAARVFEAMCAAELSPDTGAQSGHNKHTSRAYRDRREPSSKT